MSPIGKRPVAERIVTQVKGEKPKPGDVADTRAEWFDSLELPEATSSDEAIAPEDRERFLRKMTASGW